MSGECSVTQTTMMMLFFLVKLINALATLNQVQVLVSVNTTTTNYWGILLSTFVECCGHIY